MTATISTRATAVLAALILALGLAVALTAPAGGELSTTQAAAKGQPDTVPPEEPPCDADHGRPGEVARPCQDDAPGNGNGAKPDDRPGEPPCDRPNPPKKCDDGDNGNGGTDPECDEGQVYDPDTEECVDENGNGGTDPECDEGQVYDPDTEECVDENGTDELGTCEQRGLLMDETLANTLFGTENEDGPLSSALHDNLEGAVEPLAPADQVVHEVVCVVATLDNNAP